MKAPKFSLPDQDGKICTLEDYSGKWLIVYFYPKDDTPGCTKEACSFRDSIPEYKKNGINIVGISKDSVKSHKRFHEKFHLNFPLLSDESTQVIKAFGSWGKKKFMGREYDGIQRNSYLINPDGDIVKEYVRVDPITHSDQILKDFNSLS